jgi:hypothetical protein
MTQTEERSFWHRAGLSATSILHLVASIGLISALSYVLGHGILDGVVIGNDSPLHVGYVEWLDRFFPYIPHWFPPEGTGESLLHGYPLLTHAMAILVHRLGGLTTLQSIHLLSFVAYPLTAVGVYLYSWSILKRQTISLVAAVLYLLAPISWTWLYNWGFFPQQVGMIFLAPTLIAFDRALQYQLSRGRGGRGRLWFSLLVALFALGSLCHMLVGAAAGLGMASETLFLSIAAARGQRMNALRGGAKILLLLGLVAGMILAAYFVPFFNYGQVANREGLNTPSVHQLHRIPLAQFFGLKAINPLEILTRMQFPILVTALAALGVAIALIDAWRRSSDAPKALAVALTLCMSVLYAVTPSLVAIVLGISQILFNFINFRSALILVMVLMPVVSAYGLWSGIWLIVHPHRLFKSRPDQRSSMAGGGFSVGSLGTGILCLVALGALLVPSGRIASLSSTALAYGPTAVELSDIWGNAGGGKQTPLIDQLSVHNWPTFSLSDDDPTIDTSKALVSALPPDRPLRIDISPYQGRLAMDLSVYADVSQINSYGFQLDLTHAMWGYQQNVFYSREDPVNEYGNPRTLNGLAQWFGTKYVFLHSDQDPIDTYQAAGWEKTYENGTLQIWHDPSAPDMATVTTRPTVLVIGTAKSDAYMTIFRMANDGMLPYDQAMLVEGRPEVDSYTADELGAFDAVFLYGYDYKNGRKAWDTLATYVKQGGSLFVDTGWEFWVPEWQFEDAPDVLPVDRLTWTDYGPASTYELGEPEISGNVDVTKFKPLIWEGNPWTLSGADASDVRDWGRVVLSTGGRPLIVAGNYGQGKVVWSGMNLIGHARYGDPNAEEITFLGNIIRWLAGVGSGTDMQTPIMSRPDPDHVDLSFAAAPGDVTWLYWRESYYPDWHAFLEGAAGEREIPIYRGGPGLMLMPVQSDSGVASVRLEWVPSWTEQGAIVLSALGVLLLAAFFVDGLFLDGNGFTWLRIALTMRMPSPILDEEANLEMAEAQKAELERRRRGLHFGRRHATRTGRPAERRAQVDALPETPAPVVTWSTGDPTLEERLDGDQQALLQSWLESTGHDEDAWASRLIGRKKIDGQARQGKGR